MRKGLTEVVFILDRSGSMRGLEEDTIGGFNSMIEKQRKEEGEAYISTVLFDDKTEILYDRVPVAKVEPMNEKQYYVRGCTALLDAIGGAIHHIANVHKYSREEDRPEKTLFIITTDGMENASHSYTCHKVKKMVEKEKEKYGWEFLFLGANIDAIKTADRFGIGADRAMNYQCDKEGTQLNFQVLSTTISAFRKSRSKSEMDEALFSGCAPIREDYEKRHKDAKRGDLVFIDSPYAPLNPTSFESYTKEGFDIESHRRLANLYDELTDRGCYCMLTNHNTELINELYSNRGYKIDVVSVKRMINSDASNRVGEEVIICNY